MDEQQLRRRAEKIYSAALTEVEPGRALHRALKLEGDQLRLAGQVIDLSRFNHIIAVGAGKAGAPMAAALEEVLGSRLTDGAVVVKDGHTGLTRTIRIFEAGHPVPDARGVAAGRHIAALLQKYADPRTLVIGLISGGGSALLVGPAQGVSLADKQRTTNALLACGADIGQINTVRKHLSLLKGGGLTKLSHPARVVCLAISDVVGDRLDVIASGPCVPDPSTWQDCLDIFNYYGIIDQLPASVSRRLEQGLAGEIPETAKPGQAVFEGVINQVISSNRQSLAAAATEAARQGLQPLILSSTIEGETRDIARMHAALAREARQSGQPLAPPCCLISGGETTVTLGDADGKGGRNMEFALAAALDIQGLENVLALSLGTDGTDGPTEAAGAQADGHSLARARELGLDPADFLTRHDAYHFFQKLEDLIITGPTRTNVMDLRLILVG